MNSNHAAAQTMRVAGPRTAVILDAFPLWQEAIARVLEDVGIDVVGKTASAEDALTLVEELRPTLFITDIDVPFDTLDALTCLRQAVEGNSSLRTIVISGRDDQSWIESAFEAGACAYVVKAARREDLAEAMRQVLEHSAFDNGASRLFGRPDRPAAVPNRAVLTARELETLVLVAEGHSNAEVARLLWVTEQTVKFHLANIYRKLGVANRTAASRWARVHGLLPSNGNGGESRKARLAGTLQST